MKPVNVLVICLNLSKLYEGLFYGRFEWCVCVRGIGSKQNTGVSKANSASSYIWWKTKLRIDSEILTIDRVSFERKSRCIDGSIFSPTPSGHPVALVGQADIFIHITSDVFHCHAPGQHLLECRTHLLLGSDVMSSHAAFRASNRDIWSCALCSYTFHLHAEKTLLLDLGMERMVEVLHSQLMVVIVLWAIYIYAPKPDWLNGWIVDLNCIAIRGHLLI